MLRELNINEMDMVSGGVDEVVVTGVLVNGIAYTTGGYDTGTGTAYNFSNGRFEQIGGGSSGSYFSLGSGDITGDGFDYSIGVDEGGFSASIGIDGSIDAFSFRLTGEDIGEAMHNFSVWLWETGNFGGLLNSED